jgi:hypothetical protein
MSARVASRRGECRRRRSRGVAATHEAYRSRRPRSHLPPRPKSAPLAALAALFSPKSQRGWNHTESHGITCAAASIESLPLPRESQRRCHRCQTTSAVWGRLPAPSAPFLTRQPTNEAMAAARLGVLGAHLQPSCGTVCRSPTRRWAQLMSTGRALPRCCTRCRVRVADTKSVVPPPARWAQLNLGAPCHAAARAVACASLTLNPWCAPGSASLQGRGGR